MYNKIKNTFFNELNSDSLLMLSNEFYNTIREYIGNLDKNSTEYKRAMWYYLNLRKLRLYKITMLNIINENIGDINNSSNSNNNLNNITLEEKEILYQLFNVDSIEPPKHINTETDITMVRVNLNFPKFIYGNTEYNLEKNKHVKLPTNIVNILEKHGIVEKINTGE